jgi:hypothetical protein
MTKQRDLDRQLTPELQRLTMQHEAWWDRWANEQDQRDKPTAPVFHYTTWNGFLGIMQSGSFWFHSIFRMNDTTELAYGESIGRGLLQERNFAGHLAHDELIKAFCAPQLAEDRVQRFKERFDFYSISFGARDDGEQWRKYGDSKRGVAIGLTPLLFANVSKSDPAPEDKVYVAKVLYGPCECTERHRAAIDVAFDILEEARQRDLVKTNASGYAFVKTMAARMNLPLIWNSITTKSTDWKNEDELRMLAVNDLNKPHLPIHKRDDGRSYVTIPIALNTKGIISEIMVGSEAHVGADDEVEALLRDLGMSDLPPINRSGS